MPVAISGPQTGVRGEVSPVIFVIEDTYKMQRTGCTSSPGGTKRIGWNSSCKNIVMT